MRLELRQQRLEVGQRKGLQQWSMLTRVTHLNKKEWNLTKKDRDQNEIKKQVEKDNTKLLWSFEMDNSGGL